MPGMDGLEFLAATRKENLVPNAIVIALSNQNQPADIERAKALGITSYIVKANSIPSEVVAEVIKVVKAYSKN
jgi:CheY-like chemotaxis protein